MQRAAIVLNEIGGAFEHQGALDIRRRLPGRKTRRRSRHRGANDRVIALAHDADRAPVDRRDHRSFAAVEGDAVDDGCSFGGFAAAAANFGHECVEACAVAELDPG